MLNKSIYSIPYTATGIPRGDVQELAKKNHFKEKFLKMAPSYEQYKKLEEREFEMWDEKQEESEG